MLRTMFKETEDLRLALINEEIENALELYPDEPYKKIFSIPELRQQLFNYVMSKIQELYPVVKERHNLTLKPKFPYHSLELRLRIENYVHWGIKSIIELNSDWVKYLTTQDDKPGYTYLLRFGKALDY